MLTVPPLDALRYIHKADPLERRVTFDDLQTRPLGFQSAMPRDPIASMTNSFEFKVREGEMFEANKAAASTMTAEKLPRIIKQWSDAWKPISISTAIARGRPSSKSSPTGAAYSSSNEAHVSTLHSVGSLRSHADHVVSYSQHISVCCTAVPASHTEYHCWNKNDQTA